jgi:hypothetical protein
MYWFSNTAAVCFVEGLAALGDFGWIGWANWAYCQP